MAHEKNLDSQSHQENILDLNQTVNPEVILTIKNLDEFELTQYLENLLDEPELDVFEQG